MQIQAAFYLSVEVSVKKYSSTLHRACELVNHFFCEAWRLACVWARRMHTSSSRGSKRKADKNADADFTSCLALERENPLRQPRAENR